MRAIWHGASGCRCYKRYKNSPVPQLSTPNQMTGLRNNPVSLIFQGLILRCTKITLMTRWLTYGVLYLHGALCILIGYDMSCGWIRYDWLVMRQPMVTVVGGSGLNWHKLIASLPTSERGTRGLPFLLWRFRYYHLNIFWTKYLYMETPSALLKKFIFGSACHSTAHDSWDQADENLKAGVSQGN